MVVYILSISAVTKHTIIFCATQKPQKVYYSFTTKISLKLGFSTICSGIIIICILNLFVYTLFLKSRLNWAKPRDLSNVAFDIPTRVGLVIEQLCMYSYTSILDGEKNQRPWTFFWPKIVWFQVEWPSPGWYKQKPSCILYTV